MWQCMLVGSEGGSGVRGGGCEENDEFRGAPSRSPRDSLSLPRGGGVYHTFGAAGEALCGRAVLPCLKIEEVFGSLCPFFYPEIYEYGVAKG